MIRLTLRTNGNGATPKHDGFTLIELLLGMVIGTVLIGGMISVFVGYKKTAAVSEAVVEMQQAARFALEEISRDVRMAGFQGCVDTETSSARMLANSRPTDNLALTAVTASQITTSNTLVPEGPLNFSLPSAPVQAVPGSHILSVQFGSQQTNRIKPMTNTFSPVALEDGSEQFSNGDLLLISNCQVADVFEVSGALSGSIKPEASVNSGIKELSAVYGASGEANRPRIMRFESNIYFLADTGRLSPSGDPIQALYKQTLPFNMPALEIIEGVELFQLRFGIRADDEESISYVSADEINGREKQIISVHIGLLMSSINRVLDEDDTGVYLLSDNVIRPGPGPDTHAGDRRLRLPFNMTVKIRNRS